MDFLTDLLGFGDSWALPVCAIIGLLMALIALTIYYGERT